MKILAIDTSMDACSAAVYDAAADHVLAEVYEVPGRGHAEMLFAQIDQVASESGVPLSSVDRFAATIGPGTFTGVRIALATARGLALAAGKPLIGIGSLEAIAAGCRAPPGEFVAIAADARRDEVYVQAFDGEVAVAEPIVLALGDASRAFTGIGRNRSILVAGSGAPLLAEQLRAAGLAVRVLEQTWPRAQHVARLASKREPELKTPAPFYLRAPDAKLPGAETPA
jgi:tRNA threonylcarbamoyladenosine biosynthesis protein TsaB